MSETTRLDKWLWAARFFKTRSLAAQAVNGGKVHVNGARTKPAHTVKPGDVLSVTRGTDVYEITVLVLLDKRGPAKRAQALYEESAASAARRESAAAQRRLTHQSSPRPPKRPDKKSRRLLRAVKGRG